MSSCARLSRRCSAKRSTNDCWRSMRDIAAKISQPYLVIELLDLLACRVDQPADFLVGGLQASKLDLDSLERPLVVEFSRSLTGPSHQPHGGNAQNTGDIDQPRRARLGAIRFPGDHRFLANAELIGE